jgi:hypothetical protein
MKCDFRAEAMFIIFILLMATPACQLEISCRALPGRADVRAYSSTRVSTSVCRENIANVLRLNQLQNCCDDGHVIAQYKECCRASYIRLSIACKRPGTPKLFENCVLPSRVFHCGVRRSVAKTATWSLLGDHVGVGFAVLVCCCAKDELKDIFD